LESRDLVLLKAEEEDKPKNHKTLLCKSGRRGQAKNHETLFVKAEERTYKMDDLVGKKKILPQ
jgi:hypothetical protein